MDYIIEKFFTVGDIVKMNHRVVFQSGEMYGKVQLLPTKENIFCKNDYQYSGIFDSDWIGISEMEHKYKEFIMYTGVGPFELYKYIFDKYEERNI